MKALLWEGLIVGLLIYAIYSGFTNGFLGLVVSLLLGGIVIYGLLKLLIYLVVGAFIAFMARY